MYIKIEFIIILAVFFVMFILIAGLGWYHLYLHLTEKEAKKGEERRFEQQKQLTEEQEELLLENEQEIKEAKKRIKEIEEADKAKSYFLIHVIEELSIPLKAIVKLQEDVLLTELSGNTRKYSLELQKEGNALLSIMTNLQDIFKMESGQYEMVQEPYSLEELLEKIILYANNETAKKGLVFTVDICSMIPENLIGDKKAVEEILMYLISNSIKHTEEGSVCFRLDCRKNGEDVCLFGNIDDTGTGIKQEQMKSLFELYGMQESSSKCSINANKLKLIRCKRNLEFIGGTLSAESIYGVGSRFSFEIPQKKQFGKTEYVTINTLSEENPEKEKQQTNQVFQNILIVDDNIVNAKVAESLLEVYELKVHSVYSGQECLNEISSNQQYDMILMDHMMPGMDGVETLHRIRAMEGNYFSELPVIALTATVFEDSKNMFEKEGFQGLLTKPLNVAELEKLFNKCGYTETVAEEESFKEEEQEENEDNERFAVEGVDTDMGLRQWNGDLDKYKMILEVVYTDGTQKVKDMKTYLEEKNYEKYMIEAHAAKSVTAGIGAMYVSEMAKEQEFAVKGQDYKLVLEKGNLFLQEYERLLSNIESKLNLISSTEEAVGEKLFIKAEEVEARLKKIGELIDEYEDEEAISQLKDLSKYNIEIYSEDFIKGIIESLNRLNYTEAGDRIKNRRREFDEENIISRR